MRAFVADAEKLKDVRGDSKLVVFTDTRLDCVQIVVRHLYALDIATLLAHQVVMMVVLFLKLVSLHAVENIYLGYDSVADEELELSVDRGFVYGRMLLRDGR